jgi:hypothetical protein
MYMKKYTNYVSENKENNSNNVTRTNRVYFPTRNYYTRRISRPFLNIRYTRRIVDNVQPVYPTTNSNVYFPFIARKRYRNRTIRYKIR